MLLKMQLTTPLRILYDFVINEKVIFKSISDPDDTFKGNWRHEWVNILIMSSH